MLPAQAGAIDPAIWDALAKQYVTPQSRVGYARWKANARDREELDRYLQQIAQPWPAGLTQDARKATLIDAYNALTVRWILQNYPVESIWRTPHPFTKARHRVNGGMVSLDDIETELRNMHDPRIHGALVCAARSCPPLRREAYLPESINSQLDDNVRAWLANPAWNEFSPDRRSARVSMIFKWYRQDFTAAGTTVAKFLRVAPDAQIYYMPYHWGLNDTSSLGADYSNVKFLRDKLWNSL